MKRVMMNTVRATLLLAICIITNSVFAQNPGDGGDKEAKIEALKIAFITQKLSLTPEQAQKFWPIFNAYQADVKTLRKNFGMGPGKPAPSADQQLDFEQKKLDIRKKYKAQFEGAVGKEKVNILYNLEGEFRQKIKEMHEKNRGQGGPGGPGNGGGPRGPGGNGPR